MAHPGLGRKKPLEIRSLILYPNVLYVRALICLCCMAFFVAGTPEVTMCMCLVPVFRLIGMKFIPECHC